MQSRPSIAFSSSLVAGLVLFGIQVAVSSELAWESGIGSPWVIALVKMLLALSFAIGAAALFYAFERNVLYRPSVKYRGMSQMVARVIGHYYRDLSENPGNRSIIWHKRRIAKICEIISISIRENLAGNKFQVSIFSQDEPGFLRSMCAFSSDSAHVDSYVLQKRIALGEGFVGAAYSSMRPQSGNGGLNWTFKRDARLQIPGWETQDSDFKRAYLALPIVAPASLDADTLGVLAIDSDCKTDFLPGTRYERHLNVELLPILSVLEYHLTEIEKKEREGKPYAKKPQSRNTDRSGEANA